MTPKRSRLDRRVDKANRKPAPAIVNEAYCEIHNQTEGLSELEIIHLIGKAFDKHELNAVQQGQLWTMINNNRKFEAVVAMVRGVALEIASERPAPKRISLSKLSLMQPAVIGRTQQDGHHDPKSILVK